MKISIKLYTAEHCSQGTVEGQLLIISGCPCIIPVENHFPNYPDYMTCLDFDGHHIHHGEYDGPLWVDAKTVKFSREVEVEIE